MSAPRPPQVLPVRAVARRACLAVPGHNERMHAKALASGADEVVLDLEDAVAPDAKIAARDVIAATLASPEAAGRTIAVRINARDTIWFEGDLAWIAQVQTAAHLTVVVPKVESPDDLLAVDDALVDGRAPEDLGVQALLETPAGIAQARAIAGAHTRTVALIIGYADLATELGRRGAQDDPRTWLAAQEAVLSAAREHGLQAIDGPHLKLGDAASLADATALARGLGFDGKWAIHPAQVAPLNELFTPSQDDVAHARAVIDALEEAERSGGAGAVALDGQMLDEAVRVAALRVLARAKR